MAISAAAALVDIELLIHAQGVQIRVPVNPL
jgi:hypothetical protein